MKSEKNLDMREVGKSLPLSNLNFSHSDLISQEIRSEYVSTMHIDYCILYT